MSSARDLAREVARRAHCDGFEDYDLSQNGHWDFTCQSGNKMFVIRSLTSDAEKAIKRVELAREGIPHKEGVYFMVWRFQTPGEPHRTQDLGAFPGST